MSDEQANEPTGPHTWSQAAENIGCGLIMALFFLAMVAICAYGVIEGRSR